MEVIVKRVFLLAIVCLLHGHGSFAQFDIEDAEKAILPPSPTASELGRYGEVPVSLSTGTPNISIPLTSFKVRDVEVPISLSYYSGGLRVDQNETWVGLGWSLNAGGVVTRTVKDRPDNGYDIPYPEDMASMGIEALDYIDRAEDDEDIHFDSELDTYAFNFLGYSGKFVIDRNGKALIYPRQNFTIQRYIDESTTADNKIVITTGDGTIYTFGGPNGTEYSRTSSQGSGCGKSFDTFTETAFYLVSIEKPSGTVVNFEYDIYHHHYPSGISQVDKEFLGYELTCPGEDAKPSYDLITCTSYIEVKERRLARIYTNGFGDIVFTGTGLLSSISDNSGGNGLLKRFDFTYETTANNRTFLLSVDEKDAALADIKTHSFEYHDKASYPAVLDFDRDHWGYYNAANNQHLLNGQDLNDMFPVNNPFSFYSANRNPNLEATKKGVLTKINYPTGGSTTFEFELNNVNTEELVYPASVFYTKTTKGYSTTVSLDVKEEIHQMPSPTFSHSVDFTAHVSKFETMPVKDHAWIKLKDNTTGEYLVDINTRLNDPDPIGTIFLQEGHAYQLELSADAGIQVKFDMDYFSVAPTLQPVTKNVGGLRLNKMTTSDGSGPDIVKNYYYGEMSDLNSSSGLVRTKPVYYDIGKVLQQCTNSTSVCAYAISIFGQLSSSSKNNIMLIGGSHIAYQYVNVSHGNDFEGGGEQHKYSVSYDTPGELIYGEYFLNQPIKFNAWDNGQELETLIYKKESNQKIILSKTTNEYQLDNAGISEANSLVINQRYDIPCHADYVIHCDDDPTNDELWENKCITDHDHWRVATPNGWRCGAWGSNNTWVVVATFPCWGKTSQDTVIVTAGLEGKDIMEYSFKDYWSYLSKSTQIQYDENGQNPLTTVTNFYYDNPDHLQLTRSVTENSLGQQIVNKKKYPQDYTYASNTIMDKLVDANMVSFPVETINAVDGQVVSASALGFEYDATHDLLVPNEFFAYETTSPGAGYSESSNGATFSAYGSKGKILKRDAYGNVLSIQRDDNTITSYIWGYNQSLPVAKVVNATYSQIEAILGTGIGLNDYGLSAAHENTLRTDPSMANAIITTYDYQLGVGMTSQTDPNGRKTTYEYDSFGRLKAIKDHDGNVLQKNEYNYGN